MIEEEQIFLKGEIRKPKNSGQVLKVFSFEAEIQIEDEIHNNANIFIPISRDKFHSIVIEGRYLNPIDSSDRFYMVRLITHSNEFDNAIIEDCWIISNSTGFIKSDSYITRDKFVIREKDIDKKGPFGVIDLGQV